VRSRLFAVVPLTQLFELAFSVATVQEGVLNNCNRALLVRRLEPILLKRILGFVVCATKEYQTSGEPLTPQKALIPVVGFALAAPFLRLPAIDVQDVADTNVVTPQPSFAGCANTGSVLNNNTVENKKPLIQDLRNLTGFIEWA